MTDATGTRPVTTPVIVELPERHAATVWVDGRVDELPRLIGELLQSQNPTIGVYAKPDGVHVRLTAKAPTQEAARDLIQPLEAQVRSRLETAIWGADTDTLEAAIGALLNERGLTLATMESCTGGLLASTITDVPGSSAYFKGGYVAYTGGMKMGLGVSADVIEQHGTVSEECAEAMARAARADANADIGVSVTGVAGPDELEGKPPGTMHIAVDDGGPVQSVAYTYYQGRAATKRRAVTTALALLRRVILARG